MYTLHLGNDGKNKFVYITVSMNVFDHLII